MTQVHENIAATCVTRAVWEWGVSPEAELWGFCPSDNQCGHVPQEKRSIGWNMRHGQEAISPVCELVRRFSLSV